MLVFLLMILLVLTGVTFIKARSSSEKPDSRILSERPESAESLSGFSFAPEIKTLTELPDSDHAPLQSSEEDLAGKAEDSEDNPNPQTGTVFMREYPEIISTVCVENLSEYDCCILMHLISVDRVIQKFFVRAGDICSMPVSNGTYNIFAVIADTEDAIWYGPEKYFGPDGDEILVGEKIGIPWRETVNITVEKRNTEE